MSLTPSLINLFEFEAAAKERLPKEDYDYIAGGAMDELSVGRNHRAFQSWALRPRVLRDVHSVDLSTTVLGTRIQFPVLIAPCAGQKKAHADAEIAAGRAAAARGTIYAVSANASFTFEKLAKEITGHLWLQMYLFRDREMTRDWLQRATALGYEAVCLTLDSQFRSKRERNIRNNFRNDRGVNFPAADPQVAAKQSRPGEGPDPRGTWKDLEWIRRETNLPIIAKGLMTGEDVAQSVKVGANAVVVSNHGGRHIDNTLATIEVLPEAVAAADGKLEVLLDGGIRRGADVVKAIALGAKAVFIGRPMLWGLAVDGEQGVIRVLDTLRDEIEITMAKCGRTEIASIDSSVVAKAPPL